MPKLHSGRVVLTLEDSGLLILVGLLELLDFFGVEFECRGNVFDGSRSSSFEIC